jgi:transcriptional regulator of acetoin/glycerol metabolism
MGIIVQVGTANDSEPSAARAATLLRLGADELRAGRLEPALRAATDARAAFAALGRPRAAAEAEAQIALARALGGDDAAARAGFERALAGARAEGGDAGLEAGVLLFAADAAVAADDPGRARAAWERACAHFEGRDGAALARCLAGLAMLDAQDGAAASARALAARALEEAERAADPLAEGRACLAHAVVLAASDPGIAASWAGRAARVLGDAGLRRELAEACLRWGLLADDESEAIPWLERAEQVFYGLGNGRDVERARAARRGRGRAHDRAGRDDDEPWRRLAAALAGLPRHGPTASLPLEIARAAARLVGADRALVALVEAGGVPELAVGVRIGEDDTTWRGPVAAVARPGFGAALFLTDEADAGSAPRSGRALACPFEVGGRVLGALYCDRVPSGRTFGERELELATRLAAGAATLLAAHDAEAQLARAVRRRDATLAVASEGLVIVTATGRLEAWNAAAARLLGPAVTAEAPSVTSWPALAAVAGPGDEDVDGAAALLPGGAALVRARRIAGDDGAPGAPQGAVLALAVLGSVAEEPVVLADLAAGGALMRRRLRTAEAAARSRGPVIVSGEAGTGKRLLARAIAGSGVGAARPVLIECRLVADGRGLFGAAGRPGIVEQASPIPIVLVGVDDLEADARARLLERLAERGAPRVLATCRRPVIDLARRIPRDARERLLALTIDLPPLRERPEEIEALTERLLERGAARRGRPAPSPSPELLDALRAHPWPGNVAELAAVLESELDRAPEGADTLYEVPPALAGTGSEPPPGGGRSIAEAERQLLVAALRQHRGNVPRVARTLGVSKGTVYNMMRKYRVDPTIYRGSP